MTEISAFMANHEIPYYSKSFKKQFVMGYLEHKVQFAIFILLNTSELCLQIFQIEQPNFYVVAANREMLQLISEECYVRSIREKGY